MEVTMVLQGIPHLAVRLKAWDAKLRRDMKGALLRIGTAWVKEAKRRVPVDTGLLRNSINKQVDVAADGFTLAVGTNRAYGVFVEFGTDHIAGGRVKALGLSPEIDDSEAITRWPALAKRKGRGQQMPWLRPAWHAIKEKAIQNMNDALAPPGIS